MSKIEWTEDTWNPVVGCSVTSPGCTNCYAMKMAARIELMGTTSHYAGTTQSSKAGAVWTGKLALAPDSVLHKPLHRKKPTTYFVNSMGDLFHEDVPDDWIDQVFAIMALCPQHTFQVLTKRSGRMREYFAERWQGTVAMTVAGVEIPAGPETGREHQIAQAIENLFGTFQDTEWGLRFADPENSELWDKNGSCIARQYKWPLANVWLGVSAEDQTRYNQRSDDLRSTPAAVRFFSFEPLLGSIKADYLGDWAIVGGESGRNARPMHPLWPQDLRDQCVAAGTAFFFKQWGEWLPVAQDDRDEYGGWIGGGRKPKMERVSGTEKCGYYCSDEHGCVDHQEALMKRVGKKAAGRLLDGRKWNGVPG